MTFEHSAGVSVDHKDRMVAGIEQNRIGCLWADTFLREQLVAQLLGGGCQHGVLGSTVLFIQKPDEVFQPLRFLAEISRGANQLFKFGQRQFADALHAQSSGIAEVRQGTFHVGPRSVLGEDGAGEHLERSLGGPPVLWSPGARKFAVNCSNRLCRGAGILEFAGGPRGGVGARRHGWGVLPCLSCCFQPRMRALLASASASGTMPLRW